MHFLFPPLPTFTSIIVIVSFPKISTTFTAVLRRPGGHSWKTLVSSRDRSFLVRNAGEDTPQSTDDENTMDYFLGKRPTGTTTDSSVDLGMIVRDIDELAVLCDEAHHIHDKSLAWFKSIEDIPQPIADRCSL